MTRLDTTIADIQTAAKTALKILLSSFTDNEKKLLLSIYTNDPLWQLLPFEHVKDLPAIKWKLLNISKMSEEKRSESIKTLKKLLYATAT